MTERSSILLIAYGNPGRRDDGLGPACAAALEGRALAHVTIDSDYQLTVEHAAQVAEHAAVIFVDAACSGPAPFSLQALHAAANGLRGDSAVAPTFSTHSVSPAGVVALADALFGARPRAYVLGIRGYEFNEFGEGLSAPAADNLRQAADFLENLLRDSGTRLDALERAAQTPASAAV